MNKGLSRQLTIQALKGQASMEVPQNNFGNWEAPKGYFKHSLGHDSYKKK